MGCVILHKETAFLCQPWVTLHSLVIFWYQNRTTVLYSDCKHVPWSQTLRPAECLSWTYHLYFCVTLEKFLDLSELWLYEVAMNQHVKPLYKHLAVILEKAP